MLGFTRWVGTLVSIVIACLWITFIFFNPYSNLALSEETLILAGSSIALAGIGTWSAWRGRPIALIIVAILSFIPVGLYLLGTPGLFRWLGVLDLLLLFSGLLMWFSRKFPPRSL